MKQEDKNDRVQQCEICQIFYRKDTDIVSECVAITISYCFKGILVFSDK